jgi:hypothetical protein
MTNLKVVKTNKSVSKKSTKIESNLIKELELKYDNFTKEIFGNSELNIQPKAYKVELTKNGLEYLKYTISNTIWKGLTEAIQLNEIEEFLSDKSQNNSYLNLNLNFELNWSQLNRLYSFIKNVQGLGIKDAKNYFDLINKLTIPMEQLLKDQQEHKNIVLELQAAQNGISVEQMKKEMEKY